MALILVPLKQEELDGASDSVAARFLLSSGLPCDGPFGYQFFRPLRNASGNAPLACFALAHGQWALCLRPATGEVVSILVEDDKLERRADPEEIFVNSSIELFCTFLSALVDMSEADLAGASSPSVIRSHLARMNYLDPAAFADSVLFWPLMTEEARHLAEAMEEEGDDALDESDHGAD
jgi:hypothetical protein